MKINLQITYDGGVVKEIVANAADMVAFEAKFDRSVGILSSDPRMSYLFFLAYSAEKRTASTKETFEKWLETVEIVGASETDPK